MEGRCHAQGAGIRPDDRRQGSKGQIAGGELESGDGTRPSASVGLEVIEKETCGKEVSGQIIPVVLDYGGLVRRTDHGSSLFVGGPLVGAAEAVSLGHDAGAEMINDNVAAGGFEARANHWNSRRDSA